MTKRDWNDLAALRGEWLALEGKDAVEIHGWLIGVAVAIERRRGANPADTDSLIAELRASSSSEWNARNLVPLTKEEWIRCYGGQELLDREGFDVVPCTNCDDGICHGWRVVPRRANVIDNGRL